MSNYKIQQKELAKAIHDAENIRSTVKVLSTTIQGDTGLNTDCAGALSVVVEGLDAHLITLGALHMCAGQYDKEQKAEGSYMALLDEILDGHLDTAAELSGYVEILDSLQSAICQFDGSEPDAERNSAQDSLYALHRSIARFKDAQDEQMSGYTVRWHDIKAVQHLNGCEDNPIKLINDLVQEKRTAGMYEEVGRILEKFKVEYWRDVPLGQYSVIWSELAAL